MPAPVVVAGVWRSGKRVSLKFAIAINVDPSNLPCRRLLRYRTSFSFTSTRASIWPEIGHAHHFGTGELISGDDALAEFAV